MTFYKNQNQIAHDGVKRRSGRYPWGSGERPYQGESTSFRKRAKDMSNEELNDAVKRKNLENAYDKLYPEPAGKLDETKKIIDISKQGVDAAKKLVPNKPTGRQRMNLSNMSDQELRTQINRELLEKQYSDLFGDPPKEPKGRQFLRDVLDDVGPLLTVAGSAIGIALAVKQLKAMSTIADVVKPSDVAKVATSVNVKPSDVAKVIPEILPLPVGR